jgi:hypothetical protein
VLSLLPISGGIYFISITLSRSDISKSSIFKTLTIFGTCLFLTSFSHAKYDSINLRSDQPNKLELASQNPILFFAQSSEIWRLLYSDDNQRIKYHNFFTLANGLKKGADLVLPETYSIDNYKNLIVEYPGYQKADLTKSPLTNIPKIETKKIQIKKM